MMEMIILVAGVPENLAQACNLLQNSGVSPLTFTFTTFTLKVTLFILLFTSQKSKFDYVLTLLWLKIPFHSVRDIFLNFIGSALVSYDSASPLRLSLYNPFHVMSLLSHFFYGTKQALTDS